MLRRSDKGNHDTYLEAAFGRPLKEIEPMWRRYRRDAKANRAEIYRIPASTTKVGDWNGRPTVAV